MAIGSRASISAHCGVTPHAQKTGTSPGRISTGSPKSGCTTSLIPMAAETHGGDDVGIWARGPGSDAFRSTMEQHVIYHVVVQATPRLREHLCAAGYCSAEGVPVELPDPARFRGASPGGQSVPPRR